MSVFHLKSIYFITRCTDGAQLTPPPPPNAHLNSPLASFRLHTICFGFFSSVRTCTVFPGIREWTSWFSLKCRNASLRKFEKPFKELKRSEPHLTCSPDLLISPAVFPQSALRENFIAVLGKAPPRVHTHKHGTTRGFVVLGVVSAPISTERLRCRVYPAQVFHLGWFPIDEHMLHVKVSVAVGKVPL